MSTYLGIDGGIGRLKNPDYSAKAIGTKVYTKTFGRMALDGGIVRNPRDYSGKIELIPTVSGAVQSENATVSGQISRVINLSGAVVSEVATVSGTVTPYKDISGAVISEPTTVSGTVTRYPFDGWALTAFGVDYASLDPDSPFAGDPNYSAIVTGDKCHYEVSTSPDAHTVAMDANGQFTLNPATITQAQTFDVQIYDASDQSFGATATITVYPPDANISLSGGVSSGPATVSGTINTFTVISVSGAVQSEQPTMFGVVTTGDVIQVFGDVQSENATVSGQVDKIVDVSGAVSSEPATVSGSLVRIVKMSGAVQAEPATVSGVMVLPDAVITTPAIYAPNRTKRTTNKTRAGKISSKNRSIKGKKH